MSQMLAPHFIRLPKRILVVEDDKDIGSSLVEILELEGFHADLAGNGLQALEFLKSSIKPDVIILDLSMPVADGYFFRREQMKSPELADTPVIVMTAERYAETRLKEEGIKHFVRKPVDVDTLLEIVSLALNLNKSQA